ncbi:MAG: hypothetical protein HYV28_09090 [Ignavibacteriales bacterium]|nr:hypothetical protein [Ignavibacteriales bacterium]
MNLLKEVKKTTLIFGSLKEYSAVELKKTFFAKLDADFLITTPVWVNFLINYPLISNGSEYYQVGAGITVRFFPI